MYNFLLYNRLNNKSKLAMQIKHKFLKTDFGTGYITNNAILDNIPYKPEVLILGTFNPDTPNSNFADFFYGRNFFWPAFKNLFTFNSTVLINRRMSQNGKLNVDLNPSLSEILGMCAHLKLTFADLVLEAFHINNAELTFKSNDNIIYKNQEFNLIQDSVKNGVGGLEQLDSLGQINWNTLNIINFLKNNPQIHTIYFTRKPTGIWGREWTRIIKQPEFDKRTFTNIFTPSAQGKPVFHSMSRLLNHWVHNENPNFGKLEEQWLISQGVDINNF